MRRNKEDNRVKFLDSKELTDKFNELMGLDINNICVTRDILNPSINFKIIKNGVITFSEICHIKSEAFSTMNNLLEDLQLNYHFIWVDDCRFINKDFLLSNITGVKFIGSMISITIDYADIIFIDGSTPNYNDIVNILSTKIPDFKVNHLINKYRDYYNKLKETEVSLKRYMDSVDLEASKLSNEDRLKYELGKSGLGGI